MDQWFNRTSASNNLKNHVSHQLDTKLKQVYCNHPEASQHTTDCITASKRFVIDFIAFISQEYSTWQTRGFFKRDAWWVVCQIACWIFEDLEPTCVLAWYVRDKGNMEYTSASISFYHPQVPCHYEPKCATQLSQTPCYFLGYHETSRSQKPGKVKSLIGYLKLTWEWSMISHVQGCNVLFGLKILDSHSGLVSVRSLIQLLNGWHWPGWNVP